MEGQVYNPPLLPYDECIFMTSGGACSPCECVCSLQHSQATFIKHVCSSLFLNILQLFFNAFIFLWLQILRYVLIGIIRQVVAGGADFSFHHSGEETLQATSDQLHLASSLFSIWSDNQSPDSQYEEAASADVFLCVYLQRFACTDVVAYLYVNQRVRVFFFFSKLSVYALVCVFTSTRRDKFCVSRLLFVSLFAACVQEASWRTGSSVSPASIQPQSVRGWSIY